MGTDAKLKPEVYGDGSWLAIFPGIAIIFGVLAFNLIGMGEMP
jgi:ABC-type dipeptide/oligopeptide/nickel transport system permease subunit